jgi:cell division septum initiation protein DivIVA
VALRGYAEEEVDRFLDEVVVSLREYESREIEKLSTPIEAPVAALVETPEVLQPPAPQPNIVIPTPTAATEPAETPKPTTPPPPTVPSTVTRLIVTRPGEKGGRPYTVLLDDQPIGKISPGATERFEIRPGMHWVTVKTRKEQSNNRVIEPHEGDQITLRCGPASGQIDDLGRKIEGIILETAE